MSSQYKSLIEARNQWERDIKMYKEFLQGETKTFEVIINAAYAGEFYLGSVHCEAMYDNEIYARIPGRHVKVEPRKVKTP